MYLKRVTKTDLATLQSINTLKQIRASSNPKEPNVSERILRLIRSF